MTEQMQFQAEVSRLLDIVTNALYTDREIFLRELISNSSDACDRLRFDALAKPELLADDPDMCVRLIVDTEARTLQIVDNGIGMSKDELVKNLGTIAHSGTSELVDKLKPKTNGKTNGEDAETDDYDTSVLQEPKSGGDKQSAASLIGQFGVGFYSAFMVADKVEVLSRRAGSEDAWEWISDGRGSFTVEEALKDERGTEITLHLKDDAGDFLLEERLKTIVKKYSDHISFPIFFGPAGGEDAKPINSASALWMRPKDELTDEQYHEFYHHVSHVMQGDEPMSTMHWKAEGAIEYSCLLFIPGMKPFDLYDPKRNHGVKLYVKRVFITEGVEGLIPPFLRFLRGVVDSEDLPLNISREMLQNNPIVTKISKAVTRKVLGEMQKMAEDNPAQFKELWALFGPVVKEGLYDAHQYRIDLTKVVRFYSTHDNGETLVSLDEYLERMQDGQKHIYYLSAPDPETARNSPQLEGFRAKGVEVLFMTDPIDEFWLPIQNSYMGKDLKSVTRGGSDLSSIGKAETEKDEKKADAAEDASKDGADDTTIADDAVIARLKEILGDEVKDVCYSDRLTESLVCLVAQEHDVDMHLERMLKQNQGYDQLAKRILEINEKHPVVKKLSGLVANDEKADIVKDAAWLLLDQARIIEGEPLPDPSAFARRMSKVMEQGLLAGE